MAGRNLRPAVTEVEFVASNQGHQGDRIQKLIDKLRQRRPDILVRVTDASANPGLLQGHKLKFGPAVLIDGRLEFVGVPRFKMLFDRLLQVHDARPNPRTAAPAEPAKPAAAGRPAAPLKPPTGAPPPG